MKKLIGIILFLLFYTSLCFGAAKDVYVGQTALGDGSGSCSAQQSAAWFNTATSWDGGALDIAAGDTVHLCGTISTALTIMASGSSGSPITILFETGAKLSAAHWYQTGTNGDAAIYGTGKSYITIDGGTNGLIEATDNGSASLGKTYQYSIYGIRFNNADNVIIKNLSIYPMYSRVESTDSNGYGNCIAFEGVTTNITVNNNTLKMGSNVISTETSDGSANILIHNNTADDCGHACISISGGSGTLTNLQIYNNTLHKSRSWAGAGAIHTNLVHVFTDGTISGLKIYNNYFYGQRGDNHTSFVQIGAGGAGPVNYPNAMVYNNVFYKETETGTDGAGQGALNIKETSGFLVANNTFVGQTAGIGLGIYPEAMGSGHTFYNNLFYDVPDPYTVPCKGSECTTKIFTNINPITVEDYTVAYGSTASIEHSTVGDDDRYGSMTFVQWIAHLLANHSITIESNYYSTNQPSLDGSFAPLGTDIVARNKGKDLSAYFTTDKVGNARPTGALTWDIGAFEFKGGNFTGTTTGKLQ